jgi:hypothetical protein
MNRTRWGGQKNDPMGSTPVIMLAVDVTSPPRPRHTSGCIAFLRTRPRLPVIGLCTTSFGALCGEMSSRAQRGSLCEVGCMFG